MAATLMLSLSQNLTMNHGNKITGKHTCCQCCSKCFIKYTWCGVNMLFSGTCTSTFYYLQSY